MIIKNLFASLLTISMCVLFQSASYAGFYRYVDAEGNVHYSDKRTADAEKLDIHVRKPAAKVSDEKEDKEKADGETEKDAEDTAEKPKEPEKPQYTKKQKRSFCKDAKSRIASINSRGRMREINNKGEYNYLSEKQKQNRLKAAKKDQRDFCR